jgi:hypothetical protein
MGNELREENSHCLVDISSWCLSNNELIPKCMDALTFQ